MKEKRKEKKKQKQKTLTVEQTFYKLPLLSYRGNPNPDTPAGRQPITQTIRKDGKNITFENFRYF